MSIVVELPIGYFPDPNQGRPIGLGTVFIGNVDTDPEILANRKTVTLQQEDGTEVVIPPASQPIQLTAGGVFTYQGSPVVVLVEGNYSIKVLNSTGGQEYYVPNSNSFTGYDSNLLYINGPSDSISSTSTGLTAGQTLQTLHYDATRTLGSGTVFQATGTTIIGNAGNCPDTDGYFYDADGVQFEPTQEYWVEYWGAVGDGVTDDTSGIQAAIDYLNANRGGDLRFREKSYKITSLTWRANVHLIGTSIIPNSTSVGSWLIGTTGSDVLTFEVLGSANAVNNTKMEGLNISGGNNGIVSNDIVVWFELKNLRISGCVNNGIKSRGFVQQWFFDTVDLFGNSECGWLHENLDNTGNVVVSRLIDKCSFRNIRASGNGFQGINIAVSLSNSVYWDQLTLNNNARDGMLLDGGLRTWIIDSLNCERNAFGQAYIVSTGSITTGTPNLTVASTGFSNGDVVTVRGAGANGNDLEATVNSGGGTVNLVLNTNASRTVSNEDVTNAIYDNVHFDNTVASPARVSISGFSGSTNIGGDNVRYDINCDGVTSEVGLYGSQASTRGYYDPNQVMSLLGTQGELKLPFLETIANYKTTTFPQSGKASNVASPEGGNIVLGMVDSDGNSTGTYGLIEARIFDANRTRLLYVDGDNRLLASRLPICPGSFGLGTGASIGENTTGLVYGAAAPTAGTWTQGNVVFNILPTVGQPIGWTCTVSGTPGTWVAWANL